jgi:uncharacterized membrane protein YesL
MSGLFNRMYNGKNKSDFTPEHLPDNRFALFFEMLKIRFFKLIQLNLMFLIFVLPSVFFFFSFFLYTIQTLAGGAAMPDGSVATQGIQAIMGMLGQTLVLNIPCMAFMGVGIVGVTMIARNWARDQHAWMWSDFIDSIKQNWRQGLLFGLFNGVAMFVVMVAGVFYATNSGDNMLFYMLGWVMVFFLVLLGMINIYAWPMIVTYDLKLRHIFRNSFVLALGRLPWSLLFLSITVAPVALGLFFPDTLMLPMFIFYGFIGFALMFFINNSYTNAAFDRFINVRIEGAEINQGLRERDDDDDDEEGGDL